MKRREQVQTLMYMSVCSENMEIQVLFISIILKQINHHLRQSRQMFSQWMRCSHWVNSQNVVSGMTIKVCEWKLFFGSEMKQKLSFIEVIDSRIRSHYRIFHKWCMLVHWCTANSSCLFLFRIGEGKLDRNKFPLPENCIKIQ